MTVLTALRLSMTNVADPAADHGERYRAALDMAAYADRCGFTGISCEEHHLASNGWLPSPLILAAAIAGRTSTVPISVNALIVTLYDPLRLAEDIAVLDNISAGRFSFVAGMGYRPEEYHAVGRDWTRRAQLMDECLETLLNAWKDEPFEYRGKLVNVTPKPHTKPRPFFFVGGMSPAAARRAARFGLPFSPPMAMPELEALYTEELTKNGHRGFVFSPAKGSTVTLLSRDPDAAWATHGDFLMNEATEYSAWKQDGLRRPNDVTPTSAEHLRSLGNVEILTPEELIKQCEAGRRAVTMNPLIGGLPLDDAWASLRLLGDEVVPQLASPDAP
jgi:alkanesulfonate monooxygenase SsuD/methylene tetrahydromethanopterin reductase-like flavin-dependent oxidoreductase (luciferase family)